MQSRAARLAPAIVLALAVGTWATAQTRDDESRYREAAQLAGAALADLEAGNLGRARDGFTRLSRLLPENALPWINLGIVELQLDRTAEAVAALDRARAIAPDNPQLLYTEARMLETRASSDAAAFSRFDQALRRLDLLDRDDPRGLWLRGRFLREQRRFDEAADAFRAAHERSRDNLVLLVEQLVVAASSRDARATGDALDAVEDRLNGFDDPLEPHAAVLREAVETAALDALRPAALVLENLLRPTALYQVGRTELEGRESGAMLFPQLDFVPPLPKSVQGGADIDLELLDTTRASGLASALSGKALVDLEVRRKLEGGAGGAEPALLLLDDGLAELVLSGDDAQLRRDALPELAGATRILSHDFDQDARTDLLTATRGELLLFPGSPEGFAAVRRLDSELEASPEVLLPLDLDHDGDLDLLVGTQKRTRYLQNRGSGGFVDATASIGLPPDGGLAAAAAADFDEDGDLDLLLAYSAHQPRLLLDRRGGVLEDASTRAGLDSLAPAAGAAVADFDRDGRFDALLWGGAAPARILRFADGRFTVSTLGSAEASRGLTAAVVADLDNDGDQDVLSARGRELVLWRGKDGGALVAEPAGLLPSAGSRLLTLDLDGDGDLDVTARGEDGAVALLRNQGGNRNHWLRVALRGLVDNNAKNNSEGLHALVEVRTGGAYQAVLGNGGVNHLGLGARRQADVLRVVWTNGLAQTWQQLAAGQTLVEKQVLKGSCPLLYTWNGEDFEFVTDLMWRSTLGMTFGDGSAAPHESARDWVLVPASRLRPAGGEYWLQVTAELWETIYVDRQALWAVDHPRDVELVVDESFRAPPHPTEPPLHLVERFVPPAAARDHAGRDVLPEIVARDGVHVDELPLTRYQGVTSGQELRLEFAHRPDTRADTLLVLWGWIFPTDTSINVALAQDPALDAAPPRLDVLRADGTWATLLPSIGLPMGKRKAVVVELGSALERANLLRELASPLTVRVAGTMQIYWDAAALGVPARGAATKLTRLDPASADLHYRGFSRLYRESPSGPHLFDYGHTEVEPAFPPMTGRHTRYGAVDELVRAEDDRYVVMAPGDELTVRYDATSLPILAEGLSRSVVLYSDGWVKDADLNTRDSTTVEPLPYHAMRAYPDAGGHRYPDDAAHRRFLESFQTRQLDDRAFREALRRKQEP